MPKAKHGVKTVRRNLTVSTEMIPRIERVRQHLGAISDSEVFRAGIVELELKFGLSSAPATADEKKTGDNK